VIISRMSGVSVSSLRFQFRHLVFYSELFFLQLVYFQVVGTGSGKFFFNLALQGAVLFGKLCEM
jgi:hypothetical protein